MIPYIILGVGVLGLLLGFIMKQSAKKAPAVIFMVIGIIALIAFCVITVGGGANTGDAQRVIKNREGALGYGIGTIMSQKVSGGKTIDFVTYGDAGKWAAFAEAVKFSVPDATVNVELISEKEPLFFRDDKKMIKDFMTKAVKNSKADLVVINIGVAPDPAWFPSSFKGKVIFVTIADIPDAIAKKGVVIGTVKLNPAFIAEKISSDPEKAFKENYIFSESK